MDRLVMRVALAMGIVLVAAILLASAAGFLCAALYLYLSALLSQAAAAALTGLAALIAMFLIAVAGRFMLSERPRAAPPAQASPAPAREDPHMAQALSALLGEELGRTLRRHPKSTAAMALAAGVAIGVSPRLRGILIGLLDGDRMKP